MARWTKTKSGATREMLRIPEGVCLACGEETEPVALACKECRGLDWKDCDDCGHGWPAEMVNASAFNPENDTCEDCESEYCTECGLKGHCRCDEADRKYDEWKDEGAFL